MNLEQFRSETEKKQLQLIPQIANDGEAGLALLMSFLEAEKQSPPNLAISKAYEILDQASTTKTVEFLQTYFPQGILPLKSERNIDYTKLQKRLMAQDFQQADIETRLKLCELAGERAIRSKWLYFTEVERFPISDLYTINSLWWLHSEGKFGFSVQRKLWLSLGKDFAKLWPKIGWKTGNQWTKYPSEFTWSLSAPPGHLPLLNQLRGAQVIKALFAHPVWSEFSW